jgi:hypothetical protein
MPSQWLKQWFPHLPSALDRAPMAGLMCAGALLLGVALAGARSSGENDSKSAAEGGSNYLARSGSENAQKPVPFRGEELVDQLGQFSTAGDRLVFVTADKKYRFIGLENLTLQHVAKSMEGHSTQLPWLVSGTVTEYRGAYYLLLSRAEVKSPIAGREAKL